MKNLPDLPSELILAALADLKKVEEMSDEFVVNMTDWVVYRGDQCSVCLAGAVMTQSLGSNQWNKMDVPSCYDPTTADKLSALNYFRLGEIECGLWEMHIQFLKGTIKTHMPVRPYKENFSYIFHQDMMEMVKYLQSVNL